MSSNFFSRVLGQSTERTEERGQAALPDRKRGYDFEFTPGAPTTFASPEGGLAPALLEQTTALVKPIRVICSIGGYLARPSECGLRTKSAIRT